MPRGGSSAHDGNTERYKYCRLGSDSPREDDIIQFGNCRPGNFSMKRVRRLEGGESSLHIFSAPVWICSSFLHVVALLSSPLSVASPSSPSSGGIQLKISSLRERFSASAEAAVTALSSLYMLRYLSLERCCSSSNPHPVSSTSFDGLS
ncbi:unnamed protein product [Musa acuminata subsp. burmannicoides]